MKDALLNASLDIVIRPYSTGDDVFGLILPIQQMEFAVAVTAADQPDLADIDGFYRRGAGEFWVAAEGTRIVGSIALVDIGDRMGAVRKMFVAADRRGPAFGIAQRLLDVLTTHAAAAGMDGLLLGTTEKFRAAHRFYEKNGFSVVDVAALPPAFPRMAVDTRFYGKALGV
jgi:N-acetylglutamate synthase-like GNAT family acetyltransferase